MSVFSSCLGYFCRKALGLLGCVLPLACSQHKRARVQLCLVIMSARPENMTETLWNLRLILSLFVQITFRIYRFCNAAIDFCGDAGHPVRVSCPRCVLVLVPMHERRCRAEAHLVRPNRVEEVHRAEGSHLSDPDRVTPMGLARVRMTRCESKTSLTTSQKQLLDMFGLTVERPNDESGGSRHTTSLPLSQHRRSLRLSRHSCFGQHVVDSPRPRALGRTRPVQTR